MQLRHVIARLAKRDHRCDDVRATFPGQRAAKGNCPGWRVEDRANERSSRVVACAECNACNPISRQIDDRMASELPEARQAARQRDAELQRARQARKTTTHLREDPASMAVLCGHDLGRTPGGRRVHRASFAPAEATCGECIRLAAMTPEERTAERVLKFSKFDAKKAEEAAAKIQAREQRASEIEAMRPTAMVALDLVESQSKRTPDTQALLDSALRWAVEAYKHDHPKSRGERLHVLRNVEHGVGDQHCRFCGARMRRSVQVGADRTMAGAFTDVSSHTIICALKYLAGPLAPQPHNEET